jgi:Uncharacterized conserved protein (DUF2304)
LSNLAIQSLVVAGGAVAMFLIVFALSRRGLLSLRYALGWMAVSALLLLAAIGIALIGGIGKSLPFTPTGLIAAVGLAFLLLITLQLSISLSGHQEAIRELSEANALLEERVALVELHDRARAGEAKS